MAELTEYKCPCCSGAITFDSGSQKMKCPYCDSEFELESLKALDENLSSEQPDDMTWQRGSGEEWSEADGLKSYSCRSCGAQIVADDTTAASSCPYCGNQITMTGNLSGSLKPDLVIPFKLDKKAAKESLLNHYKGKKLLPKVFRDENHIDEIKGVYVPFWLFSADADANVTYDATKTDSWSDSSYDYVRTSHYNCLRGGNVTFANIPVDGSEKMDDALMESIEPFDMSAAVDFQTAYLAGYLADKYDVDAEASTERANKRAKATAESVFSETVSGYSSVSVKNSSVRLQNGTTRYALLPVWILNTTWKGKKYIFAMNGQTGKIVGDLPIDKGLYWAKWGIYAAILSVIFSALLLGCQML